MSIRVDQAITPALPAQVCVREQRPDVRILVKANGGIHLLVGAAGGKSESGIYERAVANFSLRRLLSENHADARLVLSGDSVGGVVHLEDQSRAGRNANCGAGLEGHSVSAGCGS